jgi:hypothetical protein
MAVKVISDDLPPVPVVQTSFIGTMANGWSYKPVLPNNRSHSYYVVLFFAEIDPRVNASGLRVFDLTINGGNFYPGLDVYKGAGGLYGSYEIYSPNPLGPYPSIMINGTGSQGSIFPPFIAGTEILQLLDDPMAPPTSATDGITCCSCSFIMDCTLTGSLIVVLFHCNCLLIMSYIYPDHNMV